MLNHTPQVRVAPWMTRLPAPRLWLRRTSTVLPQTEGDDCGSRPSDVSSAHNCGPPGVVVWFLCLFAPARCAFLPSVFSSLLPSFLPSFLLSFHL